LGGKVFRAENTAEKAAVVDVLLNVAAEQVTSPDKVAIAWVASKGVIPMVGPRTVEQFRSNLGSLDVGLSDEQIRRLDEVAHRMLNDDPEALEGLSGRIQTISQRVA
jgi:aryl-alcohol dehydrogenase-like predicted oxidoreductase